MSPWCHCAWSKVDFLRSLCFREAAEVSVDAKLCCLGLAARKPGVGSAGNRGSQRRSEAAALTVVLFRSYRVGTGDSSKPLFLFTTESASSSGASSFSMSSGRS